MPQRSTTFRLVRGLIAALAASYVVPARRPLLYLHGNANNIGTNFPPTA